MSNWRMICALLAAPCLLITSLAAAQDTVQPAVVAAEAADEPPDLEDLLWIARPLVIFADTENDPRFIQQMEMLEGRMGDLEDRRVVVLIDTEPAANGPLRQTLRPRGFGIVLLDTDGSVVQRRPAPTTVRELSNQIDRLPSRRLEIGSMRQ